MIILYFSVTLQHKNNNQNEDIWNRHELSHAYGGIGG